MAKYRAVISGIGAITPLALNPEETWQKLLEGRSGVKPITLFDTTDFLTRIAGEIYDFNPQDFLDPKLLRRMDRYSQLAVATADQAIRDAGLDLEKIDRDRVGVIVSSGIGGMQTFENEVRKLQEKGPRRVSPFFIPMMIADIAAGHISMRYNFRGPNYAIVSACASAANALADALDLVQRGKADIVVAGGAEATITPLGIAGFNAMKALSTRNDEPEKASRPFDAERDGFVMGEGSGILIIENMEHARARGAKMYVELAGAGLSADAYHMTAPAPEGIGAQKAMRLALQDANLQPEEVQYINAHGTSTPANDKNETIAISKVFGDYAETLNINSTKSMIGHLLGASGAVEAIVTALTIRDNKIHPTINQEHPDPDCFLNYTPNESVSREVHAALSNSFGFGGHNVTLAFKQIIS
ncbi:MAG: beta-ketoacyl-[acyl-carrier-protein] synthase II [Calditrichaeota bacterium]|nr:MAG: beta-ketoacyl-[acyl-carrier-protein] synthase II [Calditrichota bacterium]